MKRYRALAAVAVMVLSATVLTACGSKSASEKETTTTTMAPTKTLAEIASETPQLSTLLAAVQAAGLDETLSSGEYTVFAPTNDAFAQIPQDKLNALLKDKATLTKILTYHVVPGKVTAADVAKLPDVATGSKVKTVEGSDITITADGSTVTVNDATVTTADVMASNGVAHLINKVLLPPGVTL